MISKGSSFHVQCNGVQHATHVGGSPDRGRGSDAGWWTLVDARVLELKSYIDLSTALTDSPRVIGFRPDGRDFLTSQYQPFGLHLCLSS